MINILGTGNAESMPLNLDKVLKNDNVYVHIYGKKKNARVEKWVILRLLTEIWKER